MKTCGTCSLCCKLMSINELEKPQNKWCKNCDPGHGCRIYANKPKECSEFECGYLQMDFLGDEWRPDRAKFILFAETDERIIVDCDPAFPLSWQNEKYAHSIRDFASMAESNGSQLLVCIGEKVLFVTSEKIFDLGKTRNEKFIYAIKKNSVTGEIETVFPVPRQDAGSAS